MKKVAVIVVVVVAVLLALPFVTGMLTESHIRERLAAMRENPTWATFSADLVSYDRGWFTSEGRIELGLSENYVAQLESTGVPPDMLATMRLPVVLEIAHGPIAFMDGVHFGMSSLIARSDPEVPMSSEMREQLGMPYLFELRGRAGFGSGFEFDGDVPPIDYSDGDNEVDFSGLVVEGTLDGDHLVTQGTIENLDIASPFATCLIEQFRVDADYQLRPNDVAIGTSVLAVDRIAASSLLLGADPLFNATGLKVSSDIGLDEAAALMEIAVSYGAETVVAGPDMTLTDANVGITFSDLDAAAVQRYYLTIQGLGAAAAADPDAVLAELTAIVDQLLERGPSVTLDPVRFAMNGEPFSANVRVVTDPASLPPSPRNLQDPTMWLSFASVNAEADISKVLAQSIAQQFSRQQLASAADAAGAPMPDEQLDEMSAAQAGLLLVQLSGGGFLEDTGTSYTTTLEFAAGELTVNGAPIPLGL